MHSEELNGVSVVICCYNSRNRILPSLQYLAQQKVNAIKWELIIVDNNSSDGIADFIGETWRTLAAEIPVNIVTEPVPGLKFARERGIAAASFNFIVFCDDDNRLAPDYIQKVYERFTSDESIAMIGGVGEAVSEEPLPSWFRSFENLFAVGRPVAQPGPLPLGMGYLFGAGMALRKPALVELAGYGFRAVAVDRMGNVLMGGHDVEMSHALRLIGYKAVLDDMLRFGHFMESKRLTWPYLLSLARGSSSNFISFVYFIHLQRRTTSSLGFTFIYMKRLVSDLLQIIRRENEVSSTMARSSFTFLFRNFSSAIGYFRHIQSIKSISEGNK
jgi:glycosyltransferase involved in cell wall biosynthesis